MLKINQLNQDFKEKTFFGTRYNKLLGYARGLARTIDSKDSQIMKLSEQNVEFALDAQKLKKQLTNLKKKYVRTRDPKTGLFKKRK